MIPPLSLAKLKYRRSDMPQLKLTVLNLRYSSWSMRPWLTLTHAGLNFETETARIQRFEDTPLEQRRAMGSLNGLFPVLRVDGTAIHESLAICETVAELVPTAKLWPEDPMARAQARAICAEFVGGFLALRNEMPCHLFARVPDFTPGPATTTNIERIFEIWHECLERSNGPFLFGDVSIADFFYFPVLSRFRTYGIGLDDRLEAFAESLEAQPAVSTLISVARREPGFAQYDDYVSNIGGDPTAAL
jgi:glutathione S-transferase